MTSEQADRIEEKLHRIAEGLENLAGKKKKDNFDNAADEDSEIVNNDKEFDLKPHGNGKFTITRNSIAITMEVRKTEAGKLNFQFPEVDQLINLGQWIGIEGFKAQDVGQQMFMWFVANKTACAGKPIEDWILKPNFGLVSKPKTAKLKNPETGKLLTAREKTRYETAKEMRLNEEQAIQFACGLKTGKELLS